MVFQGEGFDAKFQAKDYVESLHDDSFNTKVQAENNTDDLKTVITAITKEIQNRKESLAEGYSY